MHNWGKLYSSNRKAYTFGSTYASHGEVYTKWYGKESTPKLGYVWWPAPCGPVVSDGDRTVGRRRSALVVAAGA
ncbi:hypothetical protein ABZ297_23735 [Nonomuraea sp. NPDC005983]|uniref:hypothetical protein n=1 Tax=Nonomuraea sp. NPDC005983 TaxID=3155595 RepID=UPI0033B89D48